jgi:hypothetical protein
VRSAHFSILTNSIHGYSCIFSLSARTWTASWARQSGTKRYCRTGRALRERTRKRLTMAAGCSTRTARRALHGGRLDHLLRGQRPGAQADREEQDRAALGRFFSTCATGLQPALLPGRPGLEALLTFFSSARRARARRFYWGDRGWRALPNAFRVFVGSTTDFW